MNIADARLGRLDKGTASEPTRRAFTLLELVVVIAVTGLLVATLLPALAAGRGNAAQAACASNLGRLGRAMAMYTSDNRGFMPWCQWANSYGPSWIYMPWGGEAPDPFMLAGGVLVDTTDKTQLADVYRGLYYPYIRSRPAYYCPLDKKTDVGFTRRIQRVSSYIMNGAVCGYGANTVPTFQLSQFNPNGYVQWEAKVNNYGGFYAYSSGLDAAQLPGRSGEGIASRHGGGAPILAFDSHVDWVSLEAFNAAAGSNPSVVWCAPQTSSLGLREARTDSTAADRQGFGTAVESRRWPGQAH